MEWKTCKELPKDHEHVLCDLGHKYPIRGFIHNGNWHLYYHDGCQVKDEQTTVYYWIPFSDLPSPPKQKDNA